MVAKRVLFPKTTPLAKRVRVVERRSLANRPEMKSVTFSIDTNVAGEVSGPPIVKGFTQVLITSISRGDATNQRSGDRIRVWRVEVRGYIDPNLDMFLLQNHGNNTLDESFFSSSSRGTMLADSNNNNLFTEWHHQSAMTATNRFKFTKRFKGMQVKYGGSTTTPFDNGLVVAVLNTTSTASLCQCTIRVWFTDI